MVTLAQVSSEALQKDSKVNTEQVYSLDYMSEGNRNVKVIGKLTELS